MTQKPYDAGLDDITSTDPQPDRKPDPKTGIDSEVGDIDDVDADADDNDADDALPGHAGGGLAGG
ncbi:hypothetical protein AO715_12710 [Xanthomonas sp. Mitacek01]|nr:hypothetical protein AO715_12710 [Xanthomonas sp. Mitacek01]